MRERNLRRGKAHLIGLADGNLWGKPAGVDGAVSVVEVSREVEEEIGEVMNGGVGAVGNDEGEDDIRLRGDDGEGLGQLARGKRDVETGDGP